MKTKLAIRREYARVKKQFNKHSGGIDYGHLFGAMQALAWALDDNAMAASKAFKSTSK
jgi:hypothetical protein